MAKFKNCFNSTVGEGDEIKSFLYASDGTALTQSGGALDVNIASSDISISVAESDVYAEDSAHTSGDDGAFMLAIRNDGAATSLTSDDGDYSGLAVDEFGRLFTQDAAVLAQLQSGVSVSDGGGSITVDASDLDIRDLSFASDSVDVSGSSVSISGSVSVTQDTSPWVVSATDLDIRDLSAAQDSVQIGDGTDFLAINSDGSINTREQLDQTIATSQPTVGTSAAVVATAGADQKSVTIRNSGSEPIYVGPTGVTVGTGFEIGCGEVYTFTVDADLYAIAASATAAGDLHVLQIAA
jgi:hypothetical protein